MVSNPFPHASKNHRRPREGRNRQGGIVLDAVGKHKISFPGTTTPPHAPGGHQIDAHTTVTGLTRGEEARGAGHGHPQGHGRHPTALRRKTQSQRGGTTHGPGQPTGGQLQLQLPPDGLPTRGTTQEASKHHPHDEELANAESGAPLEPRCLHDQAGGNKTQTQRAQTHAARSV